MARCLALRLPFLAVITLSKPTTQLLLYLVFSAGNGSPWLDTLLYEPSTSRTATAFAVVKHFINGSVCTSVEDQLIDDR